MCFIMGNVGGTWACDNCISLPVYMKLQNFLHPQRTKGVNPGTADDDNDYYYSAWLFENDGNDESG